MIAPDFAIEVAHIIDQSEAGVLVEITRPKAIARAIRRLLQEPALAQRLGANGRAAIEENYNWEQEEKKLLAAFEALAVKT